RSTPGQMTSRCVCASHRSSRSALGLLYCQAGENVGRPYTASFIATEVSAAPASTRNRASSPDGDGTTGLANIVTPPSLMVRLEKIQLPSCWMPWKGSSGSAMLDDASGPTGIAPSAHAAVFNAGGTISLGA